MDMAYMITGDFKADGQCEKPMAGVYFGNQRPSMQALCALGFTNIEAVEEVKPLTSQPIQPMLYFYERTRAPVSLGIISLDWSGKETSRTRANGDPAHCIPPVSGEAAERHLYTPRAFVICAIQDGQGGARKPVVAVLFLKPKPGEAPMQPDKRFLERLEIGKIQSVDRVDTTSILDVSALYLFDRSPSANCVHVAHLSDSGTPHWKAVNPGEPYSLIPPISGNAVNKFIRPKGALCTSDFPKPSAGHPAENGHAGRRPQKHPRQSRA
jgi:hypothetical protein